MLIDGNSLINRAFFGLAGRNRLTAPDGTPTGALYAFLNMFLRFKADYGPDQIVAAFDRKEPTFRHQMFDGYKATRKGMPDDLAVQLPVLKELLDLMGVGRVEVPGYEADDILGTLARKAESLGSDVAILTGDKDSFQLVDEHVSIWHPVTTTGKTEVQIYTPESVRERYTIGPEQFVDLKAIMGDPSDNIPGVKGIGEKGALDLVSRFGSLDQIYEHLAEIKPNLATKLAENREMAYLSRQLSQIDCEVPLPVSLAELKSLQPDRPACWRCWPGLISAAWLPSSDWSLSLCQRRWNRRLQSPIQQARSLISRPPSRPSKTSPMAAWRLSWDRRANCSGRCLKRKPVSFRVCRHRIWSRPGQFSARKQFRH